jgi:hypothetical protein
MNMQIGSTFKHAKFGHGAVTLTSRNGKPLELDQIASACPSVLANDKHESRSARYAFISTHDLMQGLAKEGFHPYSIIQAGSKIPGKRDFTKHLIRFRSETTVRNVNGSTYEVCLLNSHDGTTSEKMFGGFFRFACLNGSIFFDGEATEVKVLHTGNVLDKVVEGAYAVLGQAQLAIDHVENFQTLQLTRDDQMAFATAARALRFEDEHAVRPDQLLQVRRTDDRPNDLWTVFNRVQENVIRGGLGYTQVNAETHRTTQRVSQPVRSVDGDVKLNRALWVLAEEMAKIKAA